MPPTRLQAGTYAVILLSTWQFVSAPWFQHKPETPQWLQGHVSKNGCKKTGVPRTIYWFIGSEHDGDTSSSIFSNTARTASICRKEITQEIGAAVAGDE